MNNIVLAVLQGVVVMAVAPFFSGLGRVIRAKMHNRRGPSIMQDYRDLAKLFAPYFAPGASIINISSSRDRMSQPQTESYTAAKGGISALTHALAVSLAGRVRVNAIAPGWIDTAFQEYHGPDATQQPAGRVGNPMDIANLALFLASDKAGFITGENICVDGGMTRQMIYHNDFGWKLEEQPT